MPGNGIKKIQLTPDELERFRIYAYRKLGEVLPFITLPEVSVEHQPNHPIGKSGRFSINAVHICFLCRAGRTRAAGRRVQARTVRDYLDDGETESVEKTMESAMTYIEADYRKAIGEWWDSIK